MKKIRLIALSAAVVCMTAASAKAGSAILLSNGNWSDAAVWTATIGVPDTGDSAFVRGNRNVTVNSSVPTVDNVYLGEAAKGGTVNVLTGGSLTVSGDMQVSRSGKFLNCSGILNILGGSFQAASVLVGVDTTVDSTVYPSTGTLLISNATFQADNLVVGSAIAGDAGDAITVQGAAATISGSSFSLQASGILKFSYGTNGISTLDYGTYGSGGTATFSSGSQVIVDGAAYAGSSNMFTLIKAGTLGAQNCTVTLTNFAAGTTSNWDTVSDTFTVSVTGPSTEPIRPARSYILSLDNSNWTDPAAWTFNDGTIPESLDSVYVRGGRDVTINSDAGSIENFLIADETQSGAINITAGGNLITLYTGLTARPCVGRPYANGTATGYLNLSGGTLQIGSAGGEVMNVGVNEATKQTTGIFTISGGTFNGRLLVGSAIAGDSGDKVRIDGSGATIGTASTTGNALEVRASGSLEFIFGTNGISTLNYGTSGNGVKTEFASGSRIIVNGVNYTGGAQTFTLLTAGTITVPPAITLTNFAEGTTYNWDTGNDAFTVSVSGPSPARPPSDLPYVVYIYNTINSTNSTSIDEMMASVAGLANRYFPGEMLPDRDEWLDRLRAEHPEVEKDVFHSSDWTWFIDHYKSVFKGYILYDKALNAESLDVASSVAGIEDALIVDPSTLSYATNAGLTMILDARDKTQDWAWNNYSASFDKKKMFHESNSQNERLTGFWLRDYAIMCKGFSFFLPGDTGHYLGAQNKGGLLFGFGSEHDFFMSVSRNNQQSTVADGLSGAPATSGWKLPIKPQPAHAPLNALPAANKHYVAFVVSDGDNVAYLHKSFVDVERLFASPYRNNFKITWDLAPAFAEVNPFGVNYIYGLAGDDKFVCSGGHGLFYPSEVPDLPALAADTGAAMRSVDQNVISILDPSYSMSQSAALVNQPQIIGAMYKTYADAYKGLNGAMYWSSSGKPIVSVKYTLWDGFDTPASIASALNSAPRDPYNNADSFSIVNVHPWSTNYPPIEGVNMIVTNLDSNVEVVTLEELMVYLRNGYGVSHGHRPVREVYYWDRNGNTAGAGTSPSGTWGSDTAWNSSSEGTSAVTVWPTNVVASFSAGSDATGSYTVNVLSTQLVNGLEFNLGSVTLSGGAIDITGDTAIHVVSGTHEISSKLQGVGNLIKTGSGRIVLSNSSNHFTGALYLSNGTLRINGLLAGEKDISIETGATFENYGSMTGDITVWHGGTYTGSGTVIGNLINNGTMRITGGDTFNIAGTVTNNGVLDIMTGAALPVNLVNNGIVLDSADVRVDSLYTTGTNISIRIKGYSGHGYQLQKAETLTNAWVNVGIAQNGVTGGDGTPATLTLNDTNAPAGKGFYRVTVSP